MGTGPGSKFAFLEEDLAVDETLKRKILEVLDRHRVMTVATLRPDGWPQATTVGYASEGLTLPIHAYSHRDGCSVTGGYVYRGRALPDLVGAYLFGDYCNGRIWALRRLPNGRAEVSVLLESGRAISSFGEDAAGEILVCDHGGGTLRRLAAAP